MPKRRLHSVIAVLSALVIVSRGTPGHITIDAANEAAVPESPLRKRGGKAPVALPDGRCAHRVNSWTPASAHVDVGQFVVPGTGL